MRMRLGFRTLLRLNLVSVGLGLSFSAAAAYTDADIRSAARQWGVDGFLKKVADAAAASLPLQPDAYTEITTVLAIGNSINYTGRLIQLTAEEARAAGLDQIRSQIREAGTPRVCSSPIAQILITEFGARYTYTFFSKDHHRLFKYQIEKADCLPYVRK